MEKILNFIKNSKADGDYRHSVAEKSLQISYKEGGEKLLILAKDQGKKLQISTNGRVQNEANLIENLSK